MKESRRNESLAVFLARLVGEFLRTKDLHIQRDYWSLGGLASGRRWSRGLVGDARDDDRGSGHA